MYNIKEELEAIVQDIDECIKAKKASLQEDLMLGSNGHKYKKEIVTLSQRRHNFESGIRKYNRMIELKLPEDTLDKYFYLLIRSKPDTSI